MVQTFATLHFQLATIAIQCHILEKRVHKGAEGSPLAIKNRQAKVLLLKVHR